MKQTGKVLYYFYSYVKCICIIKKYYEILIKVAFVLTGCDFICVIVSKFFKMKFSLEII